MTVLLTDEQIQGEVFGFGNSAVNENGKVPQKIEYYRMICRAQLNAVVDYLNEPCTEHRNKHLDYDSQSAHRKDCPLC